MKHVMLKTMAAAFVVAGQISAAEVQQVKEHSVCTGYVDGLKSKVRNLFQFSSLQSCNEHKIAVQVAAVVAYAFLGSYAAVSVLLSCVPESWTGGGVSTPTKLGLAACGLIGACGYYSYCKTQNDLLGGTGVGKPKKQN